MGAVLHVGTVIEGSAEFKSSRLNRKDRKQSIVEELMADHSIKDYTKRKYNSIQEVHSKSKKANNKKNGFKAVRKNGIGYRK